MFDCSHLVSQGGTPGATVSCSVCVSDEGAQTSDQRPPVTVHDMTVVCQRTNKEHRVGGE